MTSIERKRRRALHQPVGRWIRADKRLRRLARSVISEVMDLCGGARIAALEAAKEHARRVVA